MNFGTSFALFNTGGWESVFLEKIVNIEFDITGQILKAGGFFGNKAPSETLGLPTSYGA
jgi:hypothetical protein